MLDGPDVTIPPRQAMAMALVVHELITNSMKHGALGSGRGRIEFSWTAGARRLSWRWRERGGPVIELKPAAGVGRSLIQGLVESELNGRAALSHPRQGADHQFITVLDGRSGDEVTARGDGT